MVPKEIIVINGHAAVIFETRICTNILIRNCPYDENGRNRERVNLKEKVGYTV